LIYIRKAQFACLAEVNAEINIILFLSQEKDNTEKVIIELQKKLEP